jgi:sulfoxide reductase heme-binding subunit YedZ
LIRTRRLLGLWCFAWATLHLTSYTLLELGLTIWRYWVEVVTRPYLTLGLISWLICWRWRRRQRKRCSENWVVAGKHCITSSILSRSSPHSLPVVGEDFIPQPLIYALLAILLLAWRYKKFRQWWR